MPQRIPAVSMDFLNCLRALSLAGSHELLSGTRDYLIVSCQEAATLLYWVPIFSSVTNKCILPSR